MLKIQQQTSSRQCLSKHQGYLLKTLCGTMMSIAVIVGAAMMTTGCSSDEPTDNSGQTDPSGSGNGTPSADWAPDSPVGKIIGWSEHNSDGTAGNTVRIEFSNATDIKTNFSDWTTYTYTKKSAKKAHLNFMAPQNVAGTVRTFQYDLDIVFTSASEFNVNGTLKVNYLSGPNVGRTVYNQFTGNGKYFTSLWGNTSDESGSPGSEVDLAKICGTWIENVDKSKPGWSLGMHSYEFRSDGIFYYSYASGIGGCSMSGKFKITANTIILTIEYDLNNEPPLKTNILRLQNGVLTDNHTNKTFTKQ